MSKKVQNTVPVFKKKPEVVFQPRTAAGFQGGIAQIVGAIRPSLGPLPRIVAIDRMTAGRSSPELLDSGGIISRRIIELPNWDENAGAMFVRGSLWNLYDRIGDGVATSAVLFQSIFDQGLQYIAAGGNGMILRRYLEQGLEAILEKMDEMTFPISGPEALTGVAKTVCHDHEMAAALGEIISIVGEYGILDIRAGHGRNLYREFVEGSYWDGGLANPKLIWDTTRSRTDFHEAAILVSDLDIEDPQEFLHIIRAALQAQVSHLVVMATRFSEEVQGLMFQSKTNDKIKIIGVKVPGMRSDVQKAAMEDIAALTGASPLFKAAGESLALVTPERLGRARRIWANMDHLGIVNGKGMPRQLREHVAKLRVAFNKVTKTEERQALQDRIGRLSGGAAALEVGGVTETEIETRKEMASRTADAVRGAAREGVLPGGGTTLLACRDIVDQTFQDQTNVDARAAHRILRKALAVPFRTILTNCGYDHGAILSRVDAAGTGYGFDVVKGEVCEMVPAGILDVAAVQRRAVINAIKGAALALTIDVIVHRKNPPVDSLPESPGK